MFRPFVSIRPLLALLFAGAVTLTSLGAAAADKHALIMQISDNNPAYWNQALNVAKNVQDAYGADKVQIEIVAFGPGLGMLKFDSEVANRLVDANKTGVMLRACGNTMKRTKVTEKDLAPGVKVVPAGAVEIMDKQSQGWSYLKL